MVSRALPRGQHAHHLVACTTDEALYSKHEAAISMLTSHPDVDGVYETEVPLITRALIKLGTKCAISSKSKSSLAKGLDNGFSLDDLTHSAMSNRRRKYLQGGQNMLFAYLYHSRQDSRHLFCLVLPTGHARLHIVDKGKNRELPNMQTYYKEAKLALDAKSTTPGIVAYSSELVIDTFYHAEPDAVFRALSKELNNYAQSRKASPTVLAICSMWSRPEYELRIPALAHYPTVMIRATQMDNTFPTRLLWQGPAAKRMVQHYLRLGVWLRDRFDAAHQANVPM